MVYDILFHHIVKSFLIFNDDVVNDVVAVRSKSNRKICLTLMYESFDPDLKVVFPFFICLLG